ncbi:MAG TPA: hypothetical protein VGT78_10180 [Rhizomicrobium sp.]|nr:hypothetical protein [Rhizomicrobium sp.]
MAIRRKKNGAQKIETRLEALQADFNALQSDLVGLANGVGHLATARVNEVVQSTEDAAGRAAERAEAWANENVGILRDTVRHQPLAACMVSVGVGAIMGAFLSRR